MTFISISKEANKIFKVYITPHWHFDHAWLFTHDQYMQALILPNFRVLRVILKKYPMYRCIVEQSTQWESLREFDPELFEDMRKYVQSGRICLVGGQITSPDLLLPSGESQVRNYFYGKRFLKVTFGKETNIAWNIDSFGHHAQYPAILRHMDMKYYVFHRGVDDRAFRRQLRQEFTTKMEKFPDSQENAKPSHILFIWKALNGRDEVLAFYQTNTYVNLLLDPIQLLNEQYFIKVLYHDKLFLQLVNAAIHVGITYWFSVKPTYRKIIATFLFFRLAIKPFLKIIPPPRILYTTLGSDFTAPSSFILHLWPYLQKIGKRRGIQFMFKTVEEFFSDCEQFRTILPMYQGNFLAHERLFSGVWSSRIKIKQASRACERLLYDVEVVATVRFLLLQEHNLDPEYPFQEIDALWKQLLINQFHDIIYGCGVDLVYLQSLRALNAVEHAAKKLLDHLIHEISSNISQESPCSRERAPK